MCVCLNVCEQKCTDRLFDIRYADAEDDHSEVRVFYRRDRGHAPLHHTPPGLLIGQDRVIQRLIGCLMIKRRLTGQMWDSSLARIASPRLSLSSLPSNHNGCRFGSVRLASTPGLVFFVYHFDHPILFRSLQSLLLILLILTLFVLGAAKKTLGIS